MNADAISRMTATQASFTFLDAGNRKERANDIEFDLDEPLARSMAEPDVGPTR
jgi:hypothetical protein